MIMYIKMWYYIKYYMYLKTIQITGFKSFAKKTNLEFKNTISSIVGPNGSGKSNVAEAFRFVLGEQSTKSMRGKKGSDLIFIGNNERQNRASVKVIFDNSNKILDIDFNEVVIERIVFRDGVNEYLLNGTKVRAKDIIELLSSANIGPSGHHIISQGEADKILSISPKERKALLEDSLGLKSYVFKKKEAERKLIKTEVNIKEAKTQEQINTPRLRYLEREVGKIEKAKDLKKELKQKYILFFSQKNIFENKKKELDIELENSQKEKKQIEKKIEIKKKELSEINKKTQNKNDKAKDIKKNEDERKEIELKTNLIQKEIIKNEILIENQLRLKKEFENQKEKIKENLVFYEQKQNSVSIIIHKILQKFSYKIIKTKNTFKEEKEVWQKFLVDYEKLHKEESKIIKEYSIDILNFFGISKTNTIKPSFNEELIQKKKDENIQLNIKLNSLRELNDSLIKKNRILSSSFNNSGEILSQEIKIEILKLEKMLSFMFSNISKKQTRQYEIQKQLNLIQTEKSYAVSIFGNEEVNSFFLNYTRQEIEDNLMEKILRIRILLENFGSIQPENITKEYNQLKENQEFIQHQLKDLLISQQNLNKLIYDVGEEVEKKFRAGMELVNKTFSEFFQILFLGGKAEIFLVNIPIKKKDEEWSERLEEFEVGLDIKVSLPNKKISGLEMLSGGERSLTSIALLFAMSSVTPPPFIVLDETDAALDEANSKRYGDMIELLAKHSQLILITHNRETMSRADFLYGVTMGNDGKSKLLSISLDEAVKVAK